MAFLRCTSKRVGKIALDRDFEISNGLRANYVDVFMHPAELHPVLLTPA
jgi:hypothetical protein